MQNLFFVKIKESFFSIFPIVAIVLILSFTPLVDLTNNEFLIFSFSSILMILGIAFFNIGADMAMQPMGEQVGSSLMKRKKLVSSLLIFFVLAILITIAEPDLVVLANQLNNVLPTYLLIIMIGIGVGIFIIIAILKIILKLDLSMLLMFFYLMLFGLVVIVTINGNYDFLGFAFDSGGVTTGPITVPFIIALGVGIGNTIGGKNSRDNSFGIIALCSIGPILIICILGMFITNKISISTDNYILSSNIVLSYLYGILEVAKSVSLSLILIVIFFLFIQFLYLKLPTKKIFQIGIGILFTFIGLVLFLTTVSTCYLPIGYKLGIQIATNNPTALIIIGFILGMVVVLAEPAIYIQTKQVEEITSGSITRKSMLIALSIGVGLAICLSMVRIIFSLSVMYFLVPTYLLSLCLSFFVPKIYTAIAFDSGGAASGPLTSSFILPFAIGACLVLQGENSIMRDAFGIVAMVAASPLISIQLISFKYTMVKKVKDKIMYKKIFSSSDEQIINF